jgi:DNA-binding MarR family transcriptional regulator
MVRRTQTAKPLSVFRAVERARHHLTQHLSAVAGSLGMTEAEGHLLAHLSHHPPVPVAELQASFGFPRSTLTNVLDRLEGRGFITREVNPDDRRSFVVSLTASGKRAGLTTRRLLSEREGAIRRAVSDSDLRGFFRVLEAIGERA